MASASRQGTDTYDHDYLYSGIKRLQAGGITSSNANYNVEINQLLEAYQPEAPICPIRRPATARCNIWRSPGDLTFMTDWGGKNSSCDTATPAICAYVWIDYWARHRQDASPVGSTCFNAKDSPLRGLLPGGTAALSANPDLAAGSINSGAAIQPFTFTEIGVDLTASGPRRPRRLLDVPNVWAHSRSSSSFTAELKDFIFGKVDLNTCSSTTTTLLQQRTNSTGDTDVTPANNGLEITVNPGAYVNDIATVTANNPAGSVAFRYYGTLEACEADTTGAGVVRRQDRGPSRAARRPRAPCSSTTLASSGGARSSRVRAGRPTRPVRAMRQ